MSDILNVLSVLLTAYGLFFGSAIQGLQGIHADAAKILALNPSAASEELNNRNRFTWAALALAIAPTAIGGLFGSVLVSILIHIRFSAPYSPVNAGTAIVIAFWVALAFVMWFRFFKFKEHKRLLSQRANAGSSATTS